MLEYFNSTHGARKGLSRHRAQDGELGLPDAAAGGRGAGLHRPHARLRHRPRDHREAAVNDGEVVASLAERVLGRVAAEDIVEPTRRRDLCGRASSSTSGWPTPSTRAALQAVRIRSPLTCEAEEGVCAMCYGRDLARGTMVNTGEAVGIIAAQSIGEPGTQLTMRTFHIGGVAQGGQQSFQEASQEGTVAFEGANTLENADGETLVMGRNMKLRIVDEHGTERASHKLGYGSKLFVKEGDTVERGDKLFEWDPYTLPIIAEKDGVAKPRGPRPGVAVRDEVDEATGMTQKIVTDWRAAPKGNELKPEIILRTRMASRCATMPATRSPTRCPWTRSCRLRGRAGDQGRRRGGADPARRRQDQGHHRRSAAGGRAVRGAPSEGSRHHRRDRRLRALSARTTRTSAASPSSPPRTAWSPRNTWSPRASTSRSGGRLRPEGRLHHGWQSRPARHPVIMGIEALANYMIDEVQEVYRLQGVKINDKHVEVIVRQMLQKWEILDSGDTTLLKGEHVDKVEFDEANAKAEKKGGRPARASRSCWASPRRRCRRGPSSRRPPSRKRRAC